MVTPFNVVVYDGAFHRTGWLNDPEALRVVLVHNGIGRCEISVPMDHPKLGLIRDRSSRIGIEYNGDLIFTGKWTGGEGTFPYGSYTATYTDDFREIYNILGWPAPTQPITNQGATSAYDKRTGSAETVAKAFVAANASRLTKPVTTATNLGRGSTITVQSRMHSLADRLITAVELAGLGITFRQSGTEIVMDVYEPAEFPVPLTVTSSVVRSGKFSETAPNMTRAVIGGAGTGTAREFRRVIDSTAEAEYADIIEGFVDARDTSVLAEMDARGTDALAEAAPTAGFSLELSETAIFSYGAGFRVGDRVTIDIGGEPTTDILRSVELSWTTEDGVVVTPTVGERSDATTALVSLVSRLYRKVSDLQRNF